MLVKRKKKKRRKEKNLPRAQTMSDVVWARLLHEVAVAVAVAVVARSVGGVWMGVDRAVVAIGGGGRQRPLERWWLTEVGGKVLPRMEMSVWGRVGPAGVVRKVNRRNVNRSLKWTIQVMF
jgi:hypothetical protein